MKESSISKINKAFNDFRKVKYIKAVLSKDFKRDCGFYYSYLVNYPLVIPDTVQVSLTYRCNLSCTTCNVRSLDMDKEMNSQKVYDIIDQTAEWGVEEILFLGGEPFLCADVMNYIDYAGRKGIKTTIVSNGTVIDEKHAQAVAQSSLCQLVISLDGACPETHDFLRGFPGIYQKVVFNIQQINKYKSFLGKTTFDPPFISIPATLMAANVSEMYDYIELGNQLEVSTVAFQPLLVDNTNLKEQNTQHPQWIYSDQLALLDEMIEKVSYYKSNRQERQAFLGNSFVHLNTIKKYFRQSHSQNDMKCYAGYTRVVIATDGNVSLCTESIGNVYKQKIQEMWYSPKAQEIRGNLKQCPYPCLQFCTIRPQSEPKAAIEKFKEKIDYQSLSPLGQRIVHKGIKKVFSFWQEKIKNTEISCQDRLYGD